MTMWFTDEHALCDDVVHCPSGEDEDGTVCMFHRLVGEMHSSLAVYCHCHTVSMGTLNNRQGYLSQKSKNW